MFGVIVKAYRKHMGWSQEDTAQKLNMSRSAISKIERGLQAFEVSTLAKLMKITGEPGIGLSIMAGMEGFQIVTQVIGG
ncbi:transcriptional regulator [Paenibacillus sp. 598K]|uniref:helix-turn-helix domain-containing protein n=1 Tax=Paenibacillus sp. 598K TaxID=1117987 RepID=UPI000FFA5F2B|nr:helix-turn-helix transcriptional regulator [Paenibacillus sp. 598K]GBF73089.1 transcriptional regulator [Paenibacillus sp. 598K]